VLNFLTSLLLLTLCSVSLAQPAADTKPLSFDNWKAGQVTDAQNQVTRYSNRIVILKNTDADINEINKLESSRRVAAKNVEFAQELTVEDYFNVYLSQFADRDAALLSAARSMSKNEVAMLLKSLLKSKSNTVSMEPSSSVLYDLTGSKKSVN
jgi:hypothetical protein